MKLNINFDIEFFYIYPMKIEQLYQQYREHFLVETDTRKDLKNKMFFALKGDNFNGNQFAKKALEAGASYAVVDDQKYLEGNRMILVEDTLSTLQQLANYHRRQLDFPIVALTGSNGKTTSKELIHAVLRQKYKCAATRGNFNNHIGVPLTLLSMTPDLEMGVVEMGANHPKEIEFLCKIAEPDFGYITNFGRVHLEGFGSLEGVIHSKTEMYRDCKARDKYVFVNANDPVQMEKSSQQKRITFGTSNSNYLTEFVEANPFVVLRFDSTIIQSKLIGAYNYSNMAAAVAMGKYFGVPDQQIKQAIEDYIPSNNRSQIIEKNGRTIILDAYNANPNSMQAAIENLAQLKNTSKIAILGDMFEVGKDSLKEHQTVVDLLEQKDFDRVFLVGMTFSQTHIKNDNITKFEQFEDLKSGMDLSKWKQATILIKASRGMALERTLEFL